MADRIYCPLEKYAEAWVALPEEWLGEHLLKRDAAIRAAAKHKNNEITLAAISLSIADGWGGIPGLEGKDPAKWEFGKIPIPVLKWLETTVFDNFSEAFKIPKASSSLSPAG